MKKVLLLAICLTAWSGIRAQSPIQLPQPEISKLSMSVGDALKSGKITAPSAVNMQDIKVYICSQQGVCLYDPKANTLVPVLRDNLLDALATSQQFVKDAPYTLLLVIKERCGIQTTGIDDYCVFIFHVSCFSDESLRLY